MPGQTAYAGLREIGRPKAGETLVVAAASGPVGSVVGQIAKIRGCRVVGIAGSKAKCDYVSGELGFDACLDHHAADFADALRAACPDGIDVYWENVGGRVFEAVLPLLNDFARVPVCGLVAWYNATELPPGPDRTPLLLRRTLVRRLTIRGFIVWDFEPGDFQREVGAWIREGRHPLSRGHPRRTGERARRLHRPARGRELRQAAGARRARSHPPIGVRAIRRARMSGRLRANLDESKPRLSRRPARSPCPARWSPGRH